MNKEELYSCLDELSWTDSILDALDASQWQFSRRKKQLNEAQLFPLVREYIELLEWHTHSRIRDVKDSASFASNLIRERFGMDLQDDLSEIIDKETYRRSRRQ